MSTLDIAKLSHEGTGSSSQLPVDSEANQCPSLMTRPDEIQLSVYKFVFDSHSLQLRHLSTYESDSGSGTVDDPIIIGGKLKSNEDYFKWLKIYSMGRKNVMLVCNKISSIAREARSKSAYDRILSLREGLTIFDQLVFDKEQPGKEPTGRNRSQTEVLCGSMSSNVSSLAWFRFTSMKSLTFPRLKAIELKTSQDLSERDLNVWTFDDNFRQSFLDGEDDARLFPEYNDHIIGGLNTLGPLILDYIRREGIEVYLNHKVWSKLGVAQICVITLKMTEDGWKTIARYIGSAHAYPGMSLADYKLEDSK